MPPFYPSGEKIQQAILSPEKWAKTVYCLDIFLHCKETSMTVCLCNISKIPVDWGW